MAILDLKKKIEPYVKTATGYVKQMLSSKHVVMEDGADLETTVTELNRNIPIVVPFTVPEFSASEGSKSITVTIPKQKNANYFYILKNHSNVNYTTEVWLTANVITRTLDSITLFVFNEKGVNIKSNEWIAVIFPNN